MIRPEAAGDEKYSDVMRVFKDLKEVRERYESTWEKINDLVLPRRSDFDWNPKKVKTPRKIYDPLPGYLARKAADGLLGNTISRSNVWFRIHASNPKVDEMRAFRKHIGEVEEALYAMLRKSTVYEASNDGVMDAMTVGHTAVYREWHEGRLIYTARHPKEIYISENRHGKVDTVIRKFLMEAREIVKEYREDGMVPERFLEEAKRNPYELHPVIQLVRPREDRNLDRIDKWNMPWESLHILEKQGVHVRESGYKRFPYPAVWRWRTNTGEAYARSPAWDALPDIERLQEIAKTMTHYAQLSVQPPLQYPLEMKGRIDRRPDGMTPYTDPQRRTYRLFESGGAYPLGQDIIRGLRDQVSEAFYADVFTILSQNMDRDKTATEVQAISGERTALLAAIAERYTNEFTTPIIADAYDIGVEEGLVPKPPEELAQYDMSVELEFLGPLAQNQKQYFQNAGINAGLSFFATAAQMWPETLDEIDPHRFALRGARAAGIPESVLRSDRERKMIQEQREKMMMEQMQAQNMQQQASAYAQTQKAPEPGSPAEKMT